MKRKIIILGLIIVLASILISGCGAIEENRPGLYPTCSTDSVPMDWWELECEDYLRQNPTLQNRDRHPGPGGSTGGR